MEWLVYGMQLNYAQDKTHYLQSFHKMYLVGQQLAQIIDESKYQIIKTAPLHPNYTYVWLAIQI